jgi:predicted HTH domain antitoxin
MIGWRMQWGYVWGCGWRGGFGGDSEMRHLTRPQLRIPAQPTLIGETMQLVLEVPSNLPDASHCTPQEFLHEAKLAMAVKLFEMKRLFYGMAASLIGMGRVEFLAELHRYGVPMIDLDQEDLAWDFANA